MKSPDLRSRHAFTLVEVLAVITIVLILLKLGSSAINGSLMAHQLSTTADSLAGSLETARLLAASKNRIVEFHIITTADEKTFFQLQIQDETGSRSVPYSSYTELPVGIQLLKDPPNGGVMTFPKQSISAGRFSGGAYTGLKFHPNGQVKTLVSPSPEEASEETEAPVTKLDKSNCFLTLGSSALPLSSELPANWVAIRIDPKTGAVTLFRP